VSGCPNSCAQHQAGDIGLAGGKVRVGGRTVLGYQLYVGADLRGDDPVVGEVVGRVAADDVPAAVEVLVGGWEALRHPGETIGATARRVGLDALAAHVTAALDDRWSAGPEPDPEPDPEPTLVAP
jgi:sulfite reductase beta subunit-like hemoprotein